MALPEPRTIRLATRQSPLALWQANWVRSQLLAAGHAVDLVLLSTRGDVDQRPIDGASAVGMFTKGIQRSVLAGESDVAIHSLKDLPTVATGGLLLAATPTRAPVADCLISRRFGSLDELPGGATIGTGSRRREAQLRYKRPDLNVQSIRGNVETRLAKLDAKEYDAIILAEAGLTRLEMAGQITERLPLDLMLPAPGQGSLGIEVRSEDDFCREAIQLLDDRETRIAVTAERELMASLQGGCLAPIGIYASCVADRLIIEAVVVAVDGSRRLHVQRDGAVADASAIVAEMTSELLAQGAADIIGAERDAR